MPGGSARLQKLSQSRRTFQINCSAIFLPTRFLFSKVILYSTFYHLACNYFPLEEISGKEGESIRTISYQIKWINSFKHLQ